MVKTVTCTHGHQWRVSHALLSPSELSELACPVCGGQADTVTDDSRFNDTHKDVLQTRGPTNDPSRLTGYELLEEAGRGGMGVVYRALDKQRNRIVALKTLQRIDAVALQRFKSEFRFLSDIAHANLVALYELISDGENWCFTMELVDGVDLLQYIQYGPDGPGGMVEQPSSAAVDQGIVNETIELSRYAVESAGQAGLAPDQLARLRSVVGQLASAISSLHAAGILHRDIKPSNVLVTREGRAVLLDFGLAAELDESEMHANSQDNILGTILYMSPEQAAGGSVSHATDWYAVGALLYEALTGKPPFTGMPLQILQAKQNTEPAPPSTIWPEAPADLNDLCIQLLRREPDKRATGSDVLRVLQQDEAVIDSPRPVPDTPERLIGREHQLAALRESFLELKEGHAVSVFVRGESGNGKSTLVQHFLDEVQRDDRTVVLSGRCYEREAVPFKAIDSMVDSLVVHLKRMSRAEVEAVMPRDIQSLARLFPVVGQIVAGQLPARKTVVSNQQELNRRAISALRELLARMGDRCQLVVYIDDLQWGDEDSAAMVADLLQPPDPPVILFLGTYRSEDAETSPFLEAFRQIQLQREVPLESLQIDVKPLDHDHAVRLALALLERDDEDARRSADVIAQEAAGNPFFVAELVQHLQLEGEQLSRSGEPLSVIDVVWSRVQRLAEDARRLLEVVALRGQPLPLDEAMELADVGESAVGPLRAGHLVRTAGSSASSIIETYHDRVRESVTDRIESEAGQQHHLRIAESYSRKSPLEPSQVRSLELRSASDDADADVDVQDVLPIWYDIAFHYDGAGRSDLAFPYALATAEKARDQFSLELSEEQYHIAERGLKGQDKRMKCRVAEGFGDVLMLRGDYEESKVRFNRALGWTWDPGTIEAKLGELAFKQGDTNQAIYTFERALRLLGHSVPRGSLAIYGKLTREAVAQVLHSVFPRLFNGRKKLRDADKQLLVIRLHNRLSYVYFFDNRELCLWSHLRGMNLAERYPATRELGHAYAIHAPVMGLVAFFNRGIVYAHKSLEIYTALGDLFGQGMAYNFNGIVLYAASRFEECIEKCRAAIQALERTGDLWEVNAARVHIAFSLFKLGDLKASAELAKRIHLSGVELGDSKASGFSLDVWAWATGGKVPADVLEAELARPRDDSQVTAQVMMADGVRLFMLDRVEEAAAVFEQGQEIAAAASLSNTYVLPLRSWLAASLRRQAEKTAEGDEANRTDLLKRAAKVAKQALRVARKFQNDLPHALRESGCIAALQGDLRKARKCLDESLTVAAAQGARFERAQSLLARAKIGQRHGWPDAEQNREAAEQSLRDMGAEFAL